MKAIRTEWKAATDFRPMRIVASDSDGNRAEYSIGAIGYTDCSAAAHREAMIALCAKMGWESSYLGGELSPGVWVWVASPLTRDQAYDTVRELRKAVAACKLETSLYALHLQAAADSIQREMIP